MDRNKLHLFVKATRSVYGPVDESSEQDAAEWTPPDKPGAGGYRGRYLWTDAFGVVNFITLFKETGSHKFLSLAKRLVQTVHDVLGRTRDGSSRLTGATEDHPLNGGLRIGKDSATGPDGDGQYHHYLTLWMFALNRLSLAAGDPAYNELAIELAQAIHPHFLLRRPSGCLRMVWKISMDMEDVLVPSEGHLDAATGYVVYRLLQHTAQIQSGGQATVLKREIDEYSEIMHREGKLTPSGDTLDLGMGLWMCHFFKGEGWADGLGEKALQMGHRLLGEDSSLMRRDASRRLAFREFGACLGIQCFGPDEYLRRRIEAVVGFWEKHLRDHTDEDLRPISQVMYAAAVIPGAWSSGYLGE
ncbi:uncharacterized protein E0L32_009884 [Thyridium curvatum]|uniref:Uncharacterized protein n=1 Tax=Thyridium curvatum TaxID=1093900 RepID=A0A507AG75_9PEZI|nr:uncharacterized protein E0L32_009884 [Thyridium curvatum]TPX08695.1 hypothetical protein E0L32_009884 [Thyridium curvatum]